MTTFLKEFANTKYCGLIRNAKMRKSMKNNRTLIPVWLLTAVILLLWTSPRLLAQSLSNATWQLVSPSLPVPVVKDGVATYTQSSSYAGQWGTFDYVSDAHLVFSLKGYTYDDNGNIIDTETIMRPSADMACSLLANSLGYMSAIVYDESYVRYYGTIIAKPGAPEGASVPLKVRLRGFADAFCVFSGTPCDVQAQAESQFSVLGGGVYQASATANNGIAHEDHEEYDLPVSITVSNGSIFYCSVYTAQFVGWNYPAWGHLDLSLQAFADPHVEIDPTYLYKDFFSLKFSTNILFTPPNPLSLSVLGVTNGFTTLQLTCPTNNVYELQAATQLAPTNWQAIAEVTNSAGTVNYTDSQAGVHANRFYRVKALRRAK